MNLTTIHPDEIVKQLSNKVIEHKVKYGEYPAAIYLGDFEYRYLYSSVPAWESLTIMKICGVPVFRVGVDYHFGLGVKI